MRPAGQASLEEGDRGTEPRGQPLRGTWDFLSKVPDWAIVGIFSVLILLQAIPSLQQESATFDETAHQPPGYLSLTAREYRLDAEHPPLIKMLTALPLLFLDVKVPPIQYGWTWKFYHDFLYTANDADRLILLGRLAVLPLILLLGFFVFRWSRELFGRPAATFALFLFSFEPNILAHGRLMNTDLGFACFFFLSIYCFARLVREITLSRLLWAGVSLGLALVSKHSAMLLPPLLVLIALTSVLARRPMLFRVGSFSPEIVTDHARKLLLLLGAVVLMVMISYVMIWGVYRFQYTGGVASAYTYISPWETVLPDQRGIRAAVLWMREAKLLPEAYLYGLSLVFRTMRRSAFLMGEISTDGWWYYFLVTFFLKTPLPLIVLLGVAVISARATWRTRGHEALFLLAPPFIYFAVSSAARLNIGHRHILPIYPFLFLFACSSIPWAARQRVFIRGALAALVGWYMYASISIFPHYLAYFNELAGGPGQGYKYLVDSNLDWGQDLKGLKRYMDAQGIRRIWLSYFGTASPEYYGIAYNYMPSYFIFNPKTDTPPTPFVAISATNLQEVYFQALDFRHNRAVSWDFLKKYKEQQPIAQIGYSIFIYRLIPSSLLDESGQTVTGKMAPPAK